MSDIERARKKLTDRVIGLPGVAGVGVGAAAGKPCLKVYLETADPDLRKRLPSSIGGFRVSVERSGPFRPRL